MPIQTDKVNASVERTIDKVRLAAAQEMLIQLLTRCAPTIVIWVGASMIIRGTMTLGTLVAFFSYLGFLYLPLERFAQLSVVVSASMAAIERIFGFLDLKLEIIDHPLSRPFAVRRGSVQFEQVSRLATRRVKERLIVKSSVASICTCPAATGWRWWDAPAPARPPWRAWFLVSTRPAAGAF